MKKSNFLKYHTEFLNWIIWYGDFLKKINDAKKIVKTKYQKAETTEAFVLRIATRWENLCIEDIITSLNIDSSIYANALNLRLRKHLTRDECKAMLFGRRYFDFKSVGDLKRFGKTYLNPNYDPFIGIQKNESKNIDEFFGIRNFLAHYSEYSKRSYKRIMIERYNYLKVPEPGYFLNSITKDGYYRWSDYLLSFQKASDEMLKIMKLL